MYKKDVISKRSKASAYNTIPAEAFIYALLTCSFNALLTRTV